jgi:hypothetical protein
VREVHQERMAELGLHPCRRRLVSITAAFFGDNSQLDGSRSDGLRRCHCRSCRLHCPRYATRCPATDKLLGYPRVGDHPNPPHSKGAVVPGSRRSSPRGIAPPFVRTRCRPTLPALTAEAPKLWQKPSRYWRRPPPCRGASPPVPHSDPPVPGLARQVRLLRPALWAKCFLNGKDGPLECYGPAARLRVPKLRSGASRHFGAQIYRPSTRPGCCFRLINEALMHFRITLGRFPRDPLAWLPTHAPGLVRRHGQRYEP